MNVDRVIAVLPERLHAEAPERIRAFLRGQPDGDVVAFLGALHREKILKSPELKRALAEVEASFTLADRGSVASEIRTAAGRYETVAPLASGAMGEVTIARDRALHRIVAVKRMDPRLMSEPAIRARFQVEVQITAQLDHPNIVPVYSVDIGPDGVPTYAMKRIRGRTLGAYLDEARKAYGEHGDTPASHALASRLEIFLQVCAAMEYAHEKGVLHRDLKPENILVGEHDDVIVMDWGIAKLIGVPESAEMLASMKDHAAADETSTNFAIGTPMYMSPEQAHGYNDDLDARSDQYALGLILYEVVALKAAVTGKAMTVLLRAQDGEKDPLEHAFGRTIPRELRAIIGKATQRDRDRRYPRVADLAADVRRFLRDEPVTAAPDTRRQALGRWVSRRRDLVLATVLGLALLVVLVGIGTGTVGAIALIVQRSAAARREQALLGVMERVQEHAQDLDAEMQSVTSLCVALGASAEQALRRPAPTDVRWIAADDFEDPARAPADLKNSAAYESVVSYDAPDNYLPPGVDPRAVDAVLRQINSITPLMQDLTIASGGYRMLALDRDQRHNAIVQGKLPVIWAYIATEYGTVTSFPGTGPYPEGYDPRTFAWYKVGKLGRGVHWGYAEEDESSERRTVPCNMGLYALDGKFLGVSGIDVGVTQLESRLLPTDWPASAWIVDADGRVIVRTGQSGTEKGVEYFKDKPLLETWTDAPSGHIERDDGSLAAWTRLPTTRWTYVVIGDARTLLERQRRPG